MSAPFLARLVGRVKALAALRAAWVVGSRGRLAGRRPTVPPHPGRPGWADPPGAPNLRGSGVASECRSAVLLTQYVHAPAAAGIPSAGPVQPGTLSKPLVAAPGPRPRPDERLGAAPVPASHAGSRPRPWAAHGLRALRRRAQDPGACARTSVGRVMATQNVAFQSPFYGV